MRGLIDLTNLSKFLIKYEIHLDKLAQGCGQILPLAANPLQGFSLKIFYHFWKLEENNQSI
jgi:hypothetical protein